MNHILILIHTHRHLSPFCVSPSTPWSWAESGRAGGQGTLRGLNDVKQNIFPCCLQQEAQQVAGAAGSVSPLLFFSLHKELKPVTSVSPCARQ